MQQRVLIVDDELQVADALCRVLSLPQGGNYQVEKCNSGEAALIRLQETCPDLLITDLQMPGISGLELLERAHQLCPNTRSLLITAFGTPEVESQVLRLANAYLPKPFSLSTFLQAVRQALNAPPISHSPLTSIPEDCVQAMMERMDVLLRDTDSMCVLLPDWAGHILAERGQRSGFDVSLLIALLGNSMAAATEVARLLNETDGFDLHYHEGKTFEVYAAMVSDTVFLALLFDRRTSGSRIGLVSLYMRRAIEDLRRMLVQASESPTAEPGMQQGLANEIDSALELALDFSLDRLPKSTSGTESVSGGNRDSQPRQAMSTAEVAPTLPAAEGATLLTLEQARARGLIRS